MSTLRILALGDTVGQPGREACIRLIPQLKKTKGVQFVVVNGENIAGGSGVTEKTAEELFQGGIDVITSGDHCFDKKEAEMYFAKEHRVLRPANYPGNSPGYGTVVVTAAGNFKVGVMNLLGRVFLSTVDCPFRTAKKCIAELRRETPVILVDMHAEATSEKIALGWYLDGEVSAIWGTHTHIQTADETILPKGTAYITDLGMTGPYRSVLGRDINAVIARFLTQLRQRFEVASEDVRLSGVIVDIDTDTGKAMHIERVHERLEA